MSDVLDAVFGAIAFAIDDGGFATLEQAIEDGGGEGRIVVEDCGPLFGGAVGAHGDGTTFVAVEMIWKSTSASSLYPTSSSYVTANVT